MHRKPTEGKVQQEGIKETFNKKSQELARIDLPTCPGPKLPDNEAKQQHQRRSEHGVNGERAQKPDDQSVSPVDESRMQEKRPDVIDEKEREHQHCGIDGPPGLSEVSAE